MLAQKFWLVVQAMTPKSKTSTAAGNSIMEIELVPNNDTIQLRGSSTNTAAVTRTVAAKLKHLNVSSSGASLFKLTANAGNKRLISNGGNPKTS